MSPLINITSPAFMWQSASNGYSSIVSLGRSSRGKPVLPACAAAREFYHLRSRRSHAKDGIQHTEPTRARDQPGCALTAAGQRAPARSSPGRRAEAVPAPAAAAPPPPGGGHGAQGSGRRGRARSPRPPGLPPLRHAARPRRPCPALSPRRRRTARSLPGGRSRTASAQRREIPGGLCRAGPAAGSRGGRGREPGSGAGGDPALRVCGRGPH